MIVPHRLAAGGKGEGGKEGRQRVKGAHRSLVARAGGKIYVRRAGEEKSMAFWLMKSEPESYGWSALVRDGAAEWDGVRNPAARLHLKAMNEGDDAFFYHSGKDKAVVGVMRIARGAAPEPGNPAWVSVRVEPVRPLPRPVALAAMKAEPRLFALAMLRQPRLSVSPVSEAEWAAILRLGEGAPAA
jgi:predicted RNA-binding protein with PUA-like domain